MPKLPTIEDAIALAATYHKGQKDKGGKPYILHILHVVLAQEDEASAMVAALHDIVEDTTVTVGDLLSWGYPLPVVLNVAALTKRGDDSYEEYIWTVCNSGPIAMKVKLADLNHNMDLTRIQVPTERDLLRRDKYAEAWQEITRRLRRLNLGLVGY